ncbi:hypothetical protein Tco_0151955 [Tanacetum coccineum]
MKAQVHVSKSFAISDVQALPQKNIIDKITHVVLVIMPKNMLREIVSNDKPTEKPEESNGFDGIIDFMNASCIKYALTVNPTVYESCIQQFWATAKAKTINGERRIQALVDKQKVIITKKSVRSDLMLEDAEGTECLPNDVIFEQLTLMGYENLT